MFFAKIRRLRSTLAFRLTLWHAGIFTLSTVIAFLLFYFSISTIIKNRTDRELSNEVAEFASLLTAKGIDAVSDNIDLEAESSGVGNMFFRVLTPEGEVLASSNMSPWNGVSTDRKALRTAARGKAHVFESRMLPDHGHGVRIVYGSMAPGMIMQIGQSLEENERFLTLFRNIFGVTLSVLMVMAAVIGWIMARRALLGVEEVTNTASEIAQGSLDTRVPLKARGDELDRLARTFNSMLDRIHSLITNMKEMTDNIAHDLRSPLARIRGIAETTLAVDGNVQDYRAMAADTVEECDRLLGMINTMLEITETGSGVGVLATKEVDLAGVVKDACELFQPLADDNHISLTCNAPAPVLVSGDVQRLQRMTANLLDNALKYTPTGGSVDVSVRGDEGRVFFVVSDTGVGISESEHTHIFKRFYRSDRSRSQSGTGLGLSLALAIASAHGGSITVLSSLGKGSTFTVVLPRHHRPS